MVCDSGTVAAVSADGTGGRGQGLKNLGVHPEFVLQTVEALFQFTSVSRAQARLLPLPVLADSAIAATPPARWLSPIAFDFPLLAQLTRHGYGALAFAETSHLVLVIVVVEVVSAVLAIIAVGRLGLGLRLRLRMRVRLRVRLRVRVQLLVHVCRRQ